MCVGSCGEVLGVHGCGYKVTFLQGFFFSPFENYSLIHCDLEVITSRFHGVTVCTFSYGSIFL